jgi:hypothetical protein
MFPQTLSFLLSRGSVSYLCLLRPNPFCFLLMFPQTLICLLFHAPVSSLCSLRSCPVSFSMHLSLPNVPSFLVLSLVLWICLLLMSPQTLSFLLFHAPVSYLLYVSSDLVLSLVPCNCRLLLSLQSLSFLLSRAPVSSLSSLRPCPFSCPMHLSLTYVSSGLVLSLVPCTCLLLMSPQTLSFPLLHAPVSYLVLLRPCPFPCYMHLPLTYFSSDLVLSLFPCTCLLLMSPQTLSFPLLHAPVSYLFLLRPCPFPCYMHLSLTYVFSDLVLSLVTCTCLLLISPQTLSFLLSSGSVSYVSSDLVLWLVRCV